MIFFRLKMLIVFALIFFVIMDISKGYNTTCLPPPVCCKSYQSNKNQTLCTECLPGYHGPNCSFSCRYPNYGEDCQSECVCAKEDCNHITGCDIRRCPKGYSGFDCNSTCQFPTYGENCVSNCSCEEQRCDFITGCTTSALNETADLPQNKTIMYISYEQEIPKKGLQNDKSAWSKMTTSHKAMLVSICIIGAIFVIFFLTIVVINKKKNVILSHYRR